jgi:hypothetical protein
MKVKNYNYIIKYVKELSYIWDYKKIIRNNQKIIKNYEEVNKRRKKYVKKMERKIKFRKKMNDILK